MLQISSERRVWSMKWLSIFRDAAQGRFSQCAQRQTDSSRREFPLFLLPLWEKVARSAG
jgi:hypothetical protein